jgi:chemotaxis protein histidine kinase CheA
VNDLSLNNDPVLLELFRAEMDAHLPALGSGLLLLEKGQAGDGEIDRMMRAAHSIKGAARIVGIDPAVQVSHAMEDCFTAIKAKQLALNADGVDVLLQAVDVLQRICAPVESEPVTDVTVSAMLEQIAAVRAGRAQSPPVAASPELISGKIDRSLPSVSFPARYDGETLGALRKEFVDTLALRPQRIAMDMSQAGQLSAGALSLLLSFARELHGNNAAVVVNVSGASEPVRALLRAVGLEKRFELDA